MKYRMEPVSKELAAAYAELEVEIDAAQDYFERTGLHLHFLNPVEQRKILEAWKEDARTQYQRGQ